MPDTTTDPFLYAHRNPDVIWMAQNTNHLPTTPKIDDAIIESVKKHEYNKYGYSKGLFGLREAILDDLNAHGNECFLTASGTEALYITFRALIQKGDVVITGDPGYLIMNKFIGLSGGATTDTPVYQKPFILTPDQIEEEVENNKNVKMLVKIDPLNPTGASYSREDTKKLCDIAHDHDLLILDDVTYRDFADENTLALEYAPERTITIYSFSKTGGLAGLRIGGLVAQPKMVEKIKAYNTNDLGLNVLAQRAALVMLETKKEWFPRVKKTTRNNQKLIKEAVDAVEGTFLPVYPSQANMFIVDILETGVTPEALQNKLLFEHNIFIRSGNYVSKRFGSRFIRVSFSVPEEHVKKFAEAFPRAMHELKKEASATNKGKALLAMN